MNISLVGIDLAKEVFQLHGINHQGKALLKKNLEWGYFSESVILS